MAILDGDQDHLVRLGFGIAEGMAWIAMGLDIKLHAPDVVKIHIAEQPDPQSGQHLLAHIRKRTIGLKSVSAQATAFLRQLLQCRIVGC